VILKEIILYDYEIYQKSVGGSSIWNTTQLPNQKDTEFMQELQSLDANRNVAHVITFLKDQGGKSSKDIEIATGLHQPQVSLALKILRKRNWITEQETKVNGSGRTLRFYALRATIEEIINYYEAEKNKESARISEAIQRLRDLTTV
jgi:predicted transcriptional regulator